MIDNHFQIWLLDCVATVTGLGLNWLIQSSLLLVVGLFTVCTVALRSEGYM